MKDKKSEKYFSEAINDFVNKIPELKKHDFLIRFAQSIIQLSDESEQTKTTAHIISNSIVKAIDNGK